MSIHIHEEQLMRLGEVSTDLPRRNGKKIHTSTVWRWTRRGLRGIRLETLRIGGTTYTSKEALQRFANQLSRIGESPPMREQPAVNVIPRGHEEATASVRRRWSG